ncbi:Nop14-like protein [Forsythia ovata]|uniref:Nop14-like protein n=1 Tax=Forsythia ovata TaxID=205694 RepID=A0ABD1XB28_9LAMI
MAKKSKPTSNGSAISKKSKNKMKNKLSVPNSVAMKNKAPKPNPFESIWSRRKFDILGKKRKGEERRVGLSRSVAIEKRKKTLLKEYEQSGKSSAFVDKRIGEQNEGLGEFDKAILRSQRERQLKLKKKSIYNLSDGEEDEFDIQGSGSFLQRDDFEDEVPFDEDEDGEAAGSAKKSTILGQLYPHGTENDLEARLMAQENRHKSKKEVMEEIISKSKFFKAQKAKDKEENEQFIEQLDKDFASIVQSEALLSLTQPNKMKALKALVNKNISVDHAEKEGISASQEKFSVQQEKPDSYDKLVGEMAMDMRARPSNRTKKPEEVAQEEKERLERLEEERKKRIVAGDDSSDDDTDASEDKVASTKELRSISGDDLAPKTYEEFSALLENCSDDQIVEAIRRIRTFNAISVAAENRKKMQVFYGVLLQYFAVLANKKPLNFKLLNLLIKPLMEMSSEIPYFAAICARQRLLHTRTKFCEDAKITGWLLYRLMEIKALKPLLCLQGQVEKINSLDFLMLMDLPDDSPHFTSDVFRASALFATIETLKGFVNIYEGFKSFPEIFLPISKLLGELAKQDHISDALQVQIKDVTQLIEKKAQEFHLLRQPLRMRKPKIIKTEIPKFEENFVKGRDYDPDRERAQRKKLKKLLGQEAKGAARELRKDNYFLLEVKERDRARLAEERAEKYGQAKAFLQEQEHAFKSGQLGSSKKRRR